MTHSSSFVRKVAYIVAMALLLVPLAIMSLPATVKRDATGRIEPQRGGVLAEMRKEAGLSQAQLGEIDPASETMKLATFGMRGVAVVLLWDKAQEYKKREDWDNLSATLEQIARLQPNFITVWEHQAHNLSYNVSVEFDDYKQRYHWVKKGIDYLIDGTEYNRNEPRLLWFAGWVVGQKIGRADERVQFRRMFKDDAEFHRMFARHGIDVEAAKGPDGKPDNWLVGRLWYQRSIQAHRDGGSIGGKSPVLFFSSPTMSLVNFLSDLEKDPNFDEDFVQAGWSQVHREWDDIAALPLDSSIGELRLNEVEQLQARIKDEQAKLDELLPGLRDEISAEKRKALNNEQRAALDKPENERDDEEKQRAEQAKYQIQVSDVELAQRAPSDKLIAVRRIVARLVSLQERLRYTLTSRQVVNFDFWRDRAAAGSTKTSAAARKHLDEAKQLFAKPDLEGAKEKFEQSFKEWAEIFEKWPTQKEDADNDDLAAAVETYVKVLEQLDLRDQEGNILPYDFPLTEIVRARGKQSLLKFRKKPESGDKPAEDKPAEDKSAEDKSAEDKSAEDKSAEDKRPDSDKQPD